MFKKIRVFALVGATALLLSLVACSKPEIPYTSKDVTQSHFKDGWQFNDLDGNKKTPKDFKGKITLVFFGYTYCPDFCPNTLWKLDQVKQALGEHGELLQTIFVTVDPERDTPQRLREYATNFPKLELITLRPTDWQLRDVKNRFRTDFVKVPGAVVPEDYLMEHMTSVLFYDKSGNIQRGAVYEQSVEEYVQDIRNMAGIK